MAYSSCCSCCWRSFRPRKRCSCCCRCCWRSGRPAHGPQCSTTKRASRYTAPTSHPAHEAWPATEAKPAEHCRHVDDPAYKRGERATVDGDRRYSRLPRRSQQDTGRTRRGPGCSRRCPRGRPRRTTARSAADTCRPGRPGKEPSVAAKRLAAAPSHQAGGAGGEVSVGSGGARVARDLRQLGSKEARRAALALRHASATRELAGGALGCAGDQRARDKGAANPPHAERPDAFATVPRGQSRHEPWPLAGLYWPVLQGVHCGPQRAHSRSAASAALTCEGPTPPILAEKVPATQGAQAVCTDALA
jgi:hypothetical protein